MHFNFPDQEEFNLIRELSPHAGVSKLLELGIGDDTAIINPMNFSGRMLIAHDQMAEGIHFSREWSSLGQIAHKLLVSNLSDIDAMGGKSIYALLTLALPNSWSKSDRTELVREISRNCLEHGVQIIGGDTTASQSAVLGMTLIGSAEHAVLRRNSAKIGQSVFVGGYLGRSAAGLFLLQNSIENEAFAPLVHEHKSPKWMPLGIELAKLEGIGAVMDLSDDLLVSLEHLCASSHCGFRIDKPKLPLDPVLQSCARYYDQDPLNWILGGGEDYVLLFTADQNLPWIRQQIQSQRIFEIGQVIESQEIGLFDGQKRISFEKISFKHFN